MAGTGYHKPLSMWEGHSVRKGYALVGTGSNQLIREISIEYLWSLNAFHGSADRSDVTSDFTTPLGPHHDALTSSVHPC